ncbi:hypothetical protein [Actinophytocola sp. NPDC049390]|uniref:hypothetical protein n=1 Tax=Actinophytocola sp. NPDC049390 TaxID=3363894 RepID=UPI0037A0E5C6
MRRFGVVVVGLALVLAAPAAVAAEPYAGGWQSPRCGVVDGDGSVSFTRNEGRAITPTSVPQQAVQYTYDVVPVGSNALLAVDNRGALRTSGDAGCTWTALGGVTGLDVPRLTAAGDGSAYVWDQNGLALYRVRGTRVTALPPVATGWGLGVAALAVNRDVPSHVRVVLGDGTVRDSHDAGASFDTTGLPVRDGADLWVYSASIDPADLDHITIGTMGEGVYTTWLGGWQWTRATMGNPGESVNAFSVAVSPANPMVVWAQGINIAEHDAHHPSEGRHVYRSTDGGRTFGVAVDHVPGQVTLVNGALLAPHPTDADVLYFVFGTSFANYGTDLFRVDARRGTLSVAHNDHHGITSILFNPRDPAVMYLGFAAE